MSRAGFRASRSVVADADAHGRKASPPCSSARVQRTWCGQCPTRQILNRSRRWDQTQRKMRQARRGTSFCCRAHALATMRLWTSTSLPHCMCLTCCLRDDAFPSVCLLMVQTCWRRAALMSSLTMTAAAAGHQTSTAMNPVRDRAFAELVLKPLVSMCVSVALLACCCLQCHVMGPQVRTTASHCRLT